MAAAVYEWFRTHDESKDQTYTRSVRKFDEETLRSPAHYAARDGNANVIRRLYNHDKARLDRDAPADKQRHRENEEKRQLQALSKGVAFEPQPFKRRTSIIVKKDYMDATPLMIAVQYNRENVVREILKIRGSALIDKDESEWTVIHYAARYNASPRIVALLGEADTGKVLASDSDSGFPLEMALLYGNGDVAAAIVASYPQFRNILYKGQSLLHLAAEKDYVNLVAALPTTSRLAMEKDETGETPLVKAILMRNDDTAMAIATRFPASVKITYEYVNSKGETLYKQPFSLTRNVELRSYLKEKSGVITIPRKPRRRVPKDDNVDDDAEFEGAPAASSSSSSSDVSDDAISSRIPAFQFV